MKKLIFGGLLFLGLFVPVSVSSDTSVTGVVGGNYQPSCAESDIFVMSGNTGTWNHGSQTCTGTPTNC